MCAKCESKTTKLDFGLEVAWMLYAIWGGFHANTEAGAYAFAIFFIVLLDSVCNKAKVLFA